MARSVEILHITDAFEKERLRVAHLFKGQQPEAVPVKYAGGIVYMTTGVSDRQHLSSVVCSTGIPYFKE